MSATDVKKKYNLSSLCPLPWNHLSVFVDSNLRLCCNATSTGRMHKEDGNYIPLKDMETLEGYYNSPDYLKIRTQMLKGERPEQCQRCFSIEDNGGTSERMDNLRRYLQDQHFIDQLNLTQPDGTIPTHVSYMDFALGNHCNIKCVMCNPACSAVLREDFEKLQWGYDTKVTQDAKEGWKDEELILKRILLCLPTTRDILITGGEPLFNPLHHKMLDAIISMNRAENISLVYHSNCTKLPEKILEKWAKFKKVNIHASIEGHGELNDYIRYGSNFQVIEDNIRKMIQVPNVTVEIFTCFDVLSMLGLPKLFSWVSDLDDKIFGLPSPILVTNPPWLQAHIIPESLKLIVKERVEIALSFHSKAYPVNPGWDHRVKKWQAMINIMMSIPSDPILWREFLQRISQLETLRGNSLKTIVPDLFLEL